MNLIVTFRNFANAPNDTHVTKILRIITWINVPRIVETFILQSINFLVLAVNSCRYSMPQFLLIHLNYSQGN